VNGVKGSDDCLRAALEARPAVTQLDGLSPENVPEGHWWWSHIEVCIGCGDEVSYWEPIQD
jgi:hypothetical protein